MGRGPDGLRAVGRDGRAGILSVSPGARRYTPTMAQLRTIKGVAVTPGLALGPVHVVRAAPERVPTWSVPAQRVERELARLDEAVARTSEQYLRHQKIVASEAGEKDGEIFAVHRMVLQDPGALKEVHGTIRTQRINAEAAVQHLINRLEGTLGGRLDAASASLRSFAADVTDPWRGVLESLLQYDRAQVLSSEQRVVLAAAELTPQVMTYVDRSRLLGVVTESGGRYSHGAVLARAFDVACVTGLPNLLNRLEQGMQVAVDGERGTVQLQPAAEDVAVFEERRRRQRDRRLALARQASLPAVTPDGETFEVHANIESLRDLDTFQADSVDGVGLLRTEFLYMERPQFPSEEEQFRLYRRVVEHMRGRPVVLRTLDIGADKQLPYFKTPVETNPALGWKGLRISLEWQDLLRVQLRAALRAGVGHDLRLLLPMVSSVEEVRATHDIFDRVRDSLVDQGYEVQQHVPVGIMIEVPSTLFVLPELMAEVDFVSVGTNDLVQYLLAVDRDNSWVTKLYEPHHPAVPLALKQVADAARAAGVHCSVCGDVADDAATTLMLLGMGYDAVSVAPNFAPEIKFAVRRTPAADARALAEEVLAQRTASGVSAVLSQMRDRILEEAGR